MAKPQRIGEHVGVPSLWLVLLVILGVVLLVNLVLILPGLLNFARTRNWGRRHR
jgi:hypothetical protein